MKAHDAVTGFPSGDAAADDDDGAGEFVAEDLGRGDVGVIDLFDVRSADAAGGNFDEDFAVGDFGDGNFFDADDALFAVDAGAHGFGDGTWRERGFQSCAGAAHVAVTSSIFDALNPGHFDATKGMY